MWRSCSDWRLAWLVANWAHMELTQWMVVVLLMMVVAVVAIVADTVCSNISIMLLRDIIR